MKVDKESELEMLAFTPDSGQIVTQKHNPYGQRHAFLVWETATGRSLPAFQSSGETLYPHTKDEPGLLAFSPDGKKLAFGGNASAITIFDYWRKKELKFAEGHREELTKIALGRNAKEMLTIDFLDTPRLWDLRSSKPMPMILTPRGDRAPTYSNDGRFSAVEHEGKIRIHNCQTGSQDRTIEIRGFHVWNVLGISRDNKQ